MNGGDVQQEGLQHSSHSHYASEPPGKAQSDIAEAFDALKQASTCLP